jgi:hypothetical protein
VNAFLVLSLPLGHKQVLLTSCKLRSLDQHFHDSKHGH